MRAVKRIRPGIIEVCDVPEGVPGPDELLVEILYSGVNPLDVQVLRGDMGDSTQRLTLGAEATGTLEGELVQVSGAGLGVARDGTFATTVVAPRSAIHEIPADADPALAAIVGVAGKTAWHVIHNLARVGPGDVVLVLGASGGVGTFAAQLAAKIEDVTVLAHTGSAEKAARLEHLGLTPVVATDAAALVKKLADRGVTVVLDPLGGDYVSALTEVVRPSGRAVMYGVLAGRSATLDLARFYGKGLTMIGTSGGTMSAEDSATALDAALAAVLDGSVIVDYEVLPLDAAADALERLRNRTVEGKLLLRP